MVHHRTETYGILLAESGKYWRARILTYPNMLWSVPHGRGTVKFIGKSAQEAESQAIEFIREHCRKKGFKLLEEDAEVESAPVETEASSDQQPKGGEEVRHLRSFVIRYGESKADQSGMTADLSKGGLFIVTSKLMSKGHTIKMLLSLEGYTVPLQGKVMWVRSTAEPGRPVGMGVQLQSPPNLYIRYIRALMGEPEEEAER
jgi:Tfp pilus assembly protein PilZ